MKIVFFHDKGEIYPLQSGGKERCVMNLAKGFAKKGNKVEILTLSANITGEKINYKGIKIRSINNYSVMRELILSLKKNDIFSFHSSNFLMPTVLDSNAYRLYYIHDIFMGLYNKGRHLDKIISFNWDKIYSPSHFVTNTVKNIYWWSDVASRIETIPRGIDLNIFYPKPKNECVKKISKELNEKYITQLKDGNPILLFPNRIDSKKGENLLYIIMGKLIIDFPKIKVILFGSQRFNEGNSLKDLTNKYSDNLILLDWQNENDLSYIYSLTDVTLILSFNPEAFCQAAIESAACGTPVVCTKFGNLRYLSEEIPLIKSSDPEPKKLLEKIKEILIARNQNEINTSLKIIHYKYNLQNVISLYLDSFSKLKKETPNHYLNYDKEKYLFSPFTYISNDSVYITDMSNLTKYKVSNEEMKILATLQSSKSIGELKEEVGFEPDEYIDKLINSKIIWKV